MTNEEYWTDKHDRGEPTVQVTLKADAQPLIDTLDNAIFETWKVTIDQAVAEFHGDEVKTDGTNRHYNIVDQMARYYTTHQFDYVTPELPEDMDEVSDSDIARMYHLLRWQSMQYDIWVK